MKARNMEATEPICQSSWLERPWLATGFSSCSWPHPAQPQRMLSCVEAILSQVRIAFVFLAYCLLCLCHFRKGIRQVLSGACRPRPLLCRLLEAH